MDKKVFCFRCEHTAGCTGCMGNAGVCGKNAETAVLYVSAGKRDKASQ